MGRHRHAVTVRADGLGAVLGPLLNDPRVVLAALVDVDSGMVLDACTPERSGARYWGADLEMTGAGHAELARVALALPGRADPTPAGDEMVVSAGPDRHHLVLALPDPHGGRLVLSVVVDGSRRLALRVMRRLRAVPAETLTAGPTVVRRPGVGGWVTPLEPTPQVDDRAAWPGPLDPTWPGGGQPVPDGAHAPGHAPGYPADPGADPDPGAGYRQFGAPRVAAPRYAESAYLDRSYADPAPADAPYVEPPYGTPPHVERGPGQWGARPDERVAVGPADGWTERPFTADPFPLRAETAPPHPAAGLFDPSPARPPVGPPPARWPRPVPEPPVTPVTPGAAPIGLVDPPIDRPIDRPWDRRPVAREEVPPVEVVRPPAPPSALPPGRPG